MMKFIYFDWFSAATEFLRLTPLDYLQSDKFTITRSTEKNITFSTISAYDAIIIERPSSDASLNLMKLAKDLKKKIIIDYDDDVLHIDSDMHPMYGTYQSEKQNSIKCIALADEVWVATEAIKRAYRLYNKNIHVIPNAWNDTVFPVKDKPPFTYNKIALWRGGFSHIDDIYEAGTTEMLLALINDNPDWQWHFWGQRWEWIEQRLKHKNHFRNSGGSTIQFQKMMQQQNSCLFFYPLANNLLNQSKSNISWLESTYCGSAYFGNTLLPEIQKPGVTGLKELPGLLKCKDKVIERTLRANHKKSWEYISKNLLLSMVNQKRMDRLLKFVK